MIEVMTITFETGPDGMGRRRFRVTWTDPEGCYRTELGLDGQPVGYRRGQYFFAKPWSHIRRWRRRGARVVVAR